MRKIIIKNEYLIIVFAIIKLIIPFLTNSSYDHHIDGYFHATLASKIELGYISVAPFIVVIAKFSLLLFGYNNFALNFFPSIIGVITLIYISLIIIELNGGKIALLVGLCAFLLSPSFLRSNNFLTPNPFDQFFWIISSYLIVKLLKYNNLKVWLWLGFVFGLGFLNKYSILFFGFSFFISLLISKNRKLIFTKYFVFSIFIFLGIISINIIWQAKNYWPVFYHIKELYKNYLLYTHIGEFLIMQLLMNLPTIGIWVLGFIYLLFSKKADNYKLFALMYLIIIIEMIVLRGKFYYIIGIYGILLIFGAVAIEKLWNTKIKIIIFFMIFSGIFTLPLSVPFLNVKYMIKYCNFYKQINIKEPLRWYDGKIHDIPHDFAIMTGSHELFEITNKFYSCLSVKEKKRTFIYAQTYGIASILSFFGNKFDLPKPICYEDNFILWNKPEITNDIMIYIGYNQEVFISFFSNIKEVGKISNPNSFLDGISIYICKNPSKEFYTYYKKITKKMKDRFHC